MKNNILHIFEKQTDAQGTIVGFNYQYYKTLRLWLDIFLNKKTDIKIYCETEDDIKMLNTKTNSIFFSQIKCYSSDFSLNSPELIKSIYNFFLLFLKYEADEIEFQFETNTSIKKTEKLLKKWIKNQNILNKTTSLLDKIETTIKSMLALKFKAETESNVTKINKKIRTLEKHNPYKNATKEKDRLESISENKTKITEIEKAHQDVISNIENKTPKFITRIKWLFRNISPEKAIQEIKQDCIVSIRQITEFENAENIGLSRLLSEVVEKSASTNINERVLDEILMLRILRETRDEMLQNTNPQIKNILQTNFDKVFSEIEEIKQQNKKKVSSMIFPNFEDGEINKFINKEGTDKKTQTRQSNLERKIKALKLEEEANIIEFATEQRCNYLLYLEKLKLQNLKLEHDSLISLEKKVRHQCSIAVVKIINAHDFNSQEFWVSFTDKLSEILDKHNELQGYKFDENFVIAQMYHQAAECHLRWTKNK